MESNKVEVLLEKYLAAETSLDEETQLKRYFSSGKVAPHLEEYKCIFEYFSVSKNENYSGKFSPKVERKRIFAWVGIAASIIILFGVFVQKALESPYGSYENPQLAMEKTKQTLQMVSKLMNSGKEDLIYLEEFGKTKDEILK